MTARPASPRTGRPPARIARLAIALLLVLGARLASAQARDTLVVGTYAYGTVDRAGAVTPLARYLAVRLGRPTRVVTAPDPVALAHAVRRGEVDVVVTNTFGYLLLADGAEPAAVAVATFRIPPGVRTDYGTVLVARDTMIRDVPALAARAGTLRVALVAPGSTTGNLVPRLFLATHGLAELERAFRSVAYAGTHAGAFAALRGGEADIAALAAEEHDRQVAAAGAGAPRFMVLWRSPDIRLGPVAVRASLPASLRDAVAAAVVGLERDAPSAFDALRGGWTEARRSDALVAASDGTYDDVRRLFGSGAAAATLIARFSRP